jgi:RNA polymerase primary sigma factor
MGQLYKSTLSREDATLNRYLHEIGKEALLSKEKEVELAIEIRNGSLEALDTLIRANLRFVVKIAKEYQNLGMSLCDLINEGNLGLIKATRRFDETKGYKFISYAVWWIRQAILLALAEESRFVRIPSNQVSLLHKINKTRSSLEQEFGRSPSENEISDKLEISPSKVMDTLIKSLRHHSLDATFNDGEDNTLLDVLYDQSQPSADEEVMGNSLKLEIGMALSTLSQREAEVIGLFFGIDREYPFKLEDISRMFEISSERVRQIRDRALNRLRNHSSIEKLRMHLSEGVSKY